MARRYARTLAATGAALAVVCAGTTGCANGTDDAGGTAAADLARADVTFVGDSWTVGLGATGHRGYAVLTGEELGREYEVLGVSGSGYTRPGTADSTFGERIGAAVATGAEVIVVQGSVNERAASPQELAPAAVATLTRLRAEADADTRILVLGASGTPGTPPAVVAWINDAVEAAADEAGVSFVDVAEENWTDPADPAIWADALHPNDAGHQLVADRLTPLLEDMLDR